MRTFLNCRLSLHNESASHTQTQSQSVEMAKNIFAYSLEVTLRRVKTKKQQKKQNETKKSRCKRRRQKFLNSCLGSTYFVKEFSPTNGRKSRRKQVRKKARR